MANNQLFIQNGVGTNVSANNAQNTIQIDLNPDAIVTDDPANSILISYGTGDPDVNTLGKIYIKYEE